jgi:hypothetical protein
VSDDQIRQAMVHTFGVRIQPNMTQYVRRRLLDGGAQGAIPVIGGDARTGVAVRKFIELDALQKSAGAMPGN